MNVFQDWELNFRIIPIILKIAQDLFDLKEQIQTHNWYKSVMERYSNASIKGMMLSQASGVSFAASFLERQCFPYSYGH
jgi:hypothetical protein